MRIVAIQTLTRATESGGEYTEAIARHLLTVRPDLVIVLGGHALRTSLVKMGLNTLFAIFGLGFRFSPPKPTGVPEAGPMWSRIKQHLGSYQPNVKLVTNLITSEEADGHTILMLQDFRVTELTVICGRDWRFAVEAVQNFLYHRYRHKGPKPRLVDLPYHSSLMERTILGWFRGVLYRAIPWACLGQMRREVLDKLDTLHQ